MNLGVSTPSLTYANHEMQKKLEKKLELYILGPNLELCER